VQEEHVSVSMRVDSGVGFGRLIASYWGLRRGRSVRIPSRVGGDLGQHSVRSVRVTDRCQPLRDFPCRSMPPPVYLRENADALGSPRTHQKRTPVWLCAGYAGRSRFIRQRATNQITLDLSSLAKTRTDF